MYLRGQPAPGWPQDVSEQNPPPLLSGGQTLCVNHPRWGGFAKQQVVGKYILGKFL